MTKKIFFYFSLIFISVNSFSQGSYNDCEQRGQDIYNQKMKLLQEKNTAVNQIMMGEFCSKCNKCKDEFPSPAAFYQHVKKVEGVVTYKDKMVAKQNKEKEYDDKIANINNAIADNQKECDELYKQWQKQRQEEVQAATNKANDEINSVNDERDARLNEIDDLNVPSTLNNGSDVAKNLPSQTTQNAISDVYGGVNTDKYKSDETDGSDLNFDNDNKFDINYCPTPVESQYGVNDGPLDIVGVLGLSGTVVETAIKWAKNTTKYAEAVAEGVIDTKIVGQLGGAITLGNTLLSGISVYNDVNTIINWNENTTTSQKVYDVSNTVLDGTLLVAGVAASVAFLGVGVPAALTVGTPVALTAAAYAEVAKIYVQNNPLSPSK